ncbi:MAG TPA: response regulator transcription factor [Burkholderiales bacterium]|nr:response regulator transcription factor [Burkholderiales bacterium]
MSYTILIVDDSKLARMAVRKVLTALRPDWTLVEAANADDALSAMEQAAPDVVVLDFNMPGRDGLDVAAEFRRLNPRMPLGVISANHQQEIVNRAHAIGASFLRKPLTEQALRKFLDDAVHQLGKIAS